MARKKKVIADDNIQQGVQEEVNVKQIDPEETGLTFPNYTGYKNEYEQTEPLVIPYESPSFILQANDFLAEPAIAFYLTSIKDDSHKAEVRLSIKAFQDYRHEHPDRMKLHTSSANAISIASVTPVKEQGGFLYRLVREREELEIKAKKLSIFIGHSDIFDRMSAEEQELMREQNEIMWQYFEVLVKRIQLLWPSGQ
jgi:hypothetical protein